MWQRKDLREGVFGSVAMIGVSWRFFGSVANKGVSGYGSKERSNVGRLEGLNVERRMAWYAGAVWTWRPKAIKKHVMELRFCQYPNK